jgi:hypothetical protein
MAQDAQTAFEVGDTVCLKSSPSCCMTVARTPSEENKDLLKPLQVECVWLDNNDQARFCRFPLAMVRKTEEPQPIGFKLKHRQ